MPKLTLDEVRDQVQSDLTSAAFGKVYAAEERRIVKVVGKDTAVIERKNALGLVDLFTHRTIGTINSIKERVSVSSDEVTLASDDFRVVGERRIRRLSTGTNGGSWWGVEVVIDYDPVDNIDLRNSTLVELCRISVDESAAESEKDGDYQATYRNPKRARKEALDGLNDNLGIA